jgi:alpha-glucosidase/alpha-D-xyloside xylohydrolase
MGDYGPAEMSPEKAMTILPKPEDLHNPVVEDVCRKYLNTRYRLLPYLYSTAAETHATGTPLMRALWLQYPNDTQLSTVSDAYMFGPDLLVAPVLESGAQERAVYLPQGDWWDFWTSERIAGGRTVSRRVDLETMPVYVRAGAILPSGPVKQFATEASDTPTTLTVYPGADGQSSLYEDDGVSFAYQQGDFIRTELRWTDASATLMLKNVEGKTSRERAFRVALAAGTAREVRLGGEALKLHL